MNNPEYVRELFQKEGYYAEFKQFNNDAERILFCGIKDHTFIIKPGREFYLKISEGRYNIQYSEAQLGLEKDFTDLEALIKFVQQLFPIEK
ncbi:hypothetical protein AOB46_14500 [Chryseobacterium indologenes]|uniref:Uncharacterized protein n=2 Tax=Chryseobacterium indologenes TaxID=253 RepID=A0A0N0IVJ3_CHRID|nr:hypothetical protein AOB46_14500 [Chryseobacterium indologenes]